MALSCPKANTHHPIFGIDGQRANREAVVSRLKRAFQNPKSFHPKSINQKRQEAEKRLISGFRCSIVLLIIFFKGKRNVVTAKSKRVGESDLYSLLATLMGDVI
jgi:hypothetical protein